MARHGDRAAAQQDEASALRSALAELERSVLESPGSVALEVRRSAFGGEVPPELTEIVEKIRRHAYKITDPDIGRLRACGYSEDQLFEITIAAAVGAGASRLGAGMSALRGSA